MFKFAYKLFLSKWKKLNNTAVNDFLDYFNKEWMGIDKLGWYEGFVEGQNVPSTDNALESKNCKIKDVSTVTFSF